MHEICVSTDRRRQEQKEQLEALVTDGDYAGAAVLNADMEKEAEAQVASVRDVVVARDRRRQ